MASGERDHEQDSDAAFQFLTGLENVANSCYLNAACQALLSCEQYITTLKYA
eukprot:gene8225-7564_t